MQEIASKASESLQNRLYYSPTKKDYAVQTCFACDRFGTVDNPCSLRTIDSAVSLLKRAKAERSSLQRHTQNDALLSCHESDIPCFNSCLVSPRANPVRDANGRDCAFECLECKQEWQAQGAETLSRRKIDGPSRAMWKAFVAGDPPACLLELNKAEIQLVSPNRVHAHGVVLNANAHEGIYGWHSMFENRVDLNVATVQCLLDAGMNGEFVCVSCGPFTRSQEVHARNTFCIRPHKVIAAFEWLKANNHCFADIEVPRAADLPKPRFLMHDSLQVTFRIR